MVGSPPLGMERAEGQRLVVRRFRVKEYGKRWRSGKKGGHSGILFDGIAGKGGCVKKEGRRASVKKARRVPGRRDKSFRRELIFFGKEKFWGHIDRYRQKLNCVGWRVEGGGAWKVAIGPYKKEGLCRLRVRAQKPSGGGSNGF